MMTHPPSQDPPDDAHAPKTHDADSRTDRILSRENSYRSMNLHSVYNEPAFLPSQQDQPIEGNWVCDRCGYNLRGLRSGHPCPECGSIELYALPPEDAPSYGKWITTQKSRVTWIRSWSSVIIASVIFTPAAVIGAMMNSTLLGGFTLFFAGPILEEAVKMAAVYWLVESRPYLVRHAWQLIFAGLACGLVYGSFENVLFLYVYANTPAKFTVLLRWFICPAVHMLCCTLVALGLVRVWQRPILGARPPKISQGLPHFAAAVALHGIYNACAISLHYAALVI